MVAEQEPESPGEELHDRSPSSISVRRDISGHQVPQAIAHRGFSAKFPENTMSSFTAAIKAGAHGLETDVHLSKDDVVVLSHDAKLTRCFGENKKVIDCDWGYLSTLRTVKEPHDRMLRLLDLLEYLATPGLENIWLMLDIKVDNNADNIMRFIANTIHEAAPSSKPWIERIRLGCWTMEYVPFRDKYLPGFPISHIGRDLYYAREFLKVPDVSFNILQRVIVGPVGQSFLRDVRAAGRDVFVWTVNKPNGMRWSIRNEVNGVLTDDPAALIKFCEEYDGQCTKEDEPSFEAYLIIIGVNIWTTLTCLKMYFRWVFGFQFSSTWLVSGKNARRSEGFA